VTYSLKIKGSAAKALSKIAKTDRHRLIEAIDRLRSEPAAGGVLKGEFSGLRRLRVGNYRVVYEVVAKELIILVVRVGHRRDVYRKK
jgi:mRNA interferase RelE/StbE